jgi:hypothetical protein
MTSRVMDGACTAAKNRHTNHPPRSFFMTASCTTANASLDRLVDTHLAAYAEPDAARRLALLKDSWSLEGRLIDPPFDATGHQGISNQAAMLLGQFPGHRFERTTAIDAHHEVLRYGWRLVNPAGTAVVEGIDVVDLDVDGRISRVVGFFGTQPPAMAAAAW